MKKSTGWGGSGVTFCDNEDQVATVYRKYSEVTRWKGMLKARLIQARGWALGPDWFPTDPSVTVNEAVYGKPAMIAVSAVNGKVLSHATAIKELCYPQVTSPSSVVRFVEHQDMKKTVVDLVAHWGATGFLGFDFMLSADGSTRLIECNARPTFLSYMGALSGSDLCLALHHYLVGIEIPTPSVPQQELAAHFPNEWRRDPKSPHLLSAYHDVPWDDPGLLAKLIKEWK